MVGLTVLSGGRADADHHVAKSADGCHHLLDVAWLIEGCAQPHRRLVHQHLLEGGELEEAGTEGYAAVAHQPPRLERMRSTASLKRSSGTVSEIRNQPSPLRPYAPPGEITTPDSSRTSSQ